MAKFAWPRAFLAAAIASLAFFAWGWTVPRMPTQALAAPLGDMLVINTDGGSLDAARKKYWYDPFTKETGVRITIVTPEDNAKLKAMVTAGNVEIDLIPATGTDFARDVQEGLLEKLDLSQLDLSDIPKSALSEYGLWQTAYSTVLAWDLQKWPMSGKHPTSLKDLWNQADFPGPRCLRKYPSGNLEIALYYSGTPRNKVYPLDQDRAYRELDKLKQYVTAWWTTGSQSMQMFAGRECVMGTIYNGRTYPLITEQHVPLGVAWDGAYMEDGWWMVPKGAKHKAAALAFLKYIMDPKRQAEYANETTYLGPSVKAAQLVDANVRSFLANSPEHLAQSIIVDDFWWGKNGAAAEQRFLSWLVR